MATIFSARNLHETHIDNMAAAIGKLDRTDPTRRRWDAENYLNESLTLETKAAGTRLSGTWMVWLRPSFWRVIR
jgi:hypothetical protein